MSEQIKDFIYGVDDQPPFLAMFFLAIQHIILMTSTLVLPIMLISEIGGSFEQIRSVVGMTMIACGIGTILQALRCRFLGSGFLCPNLCGPTYFLASLNAVWLGGLPLMRGMTIISGIIGLFSARLIKVIKFLFPTEIIGLIILMIAQRLIPLGISRFCGVNFEGDPIQAANVLVGSVTLFIIIAAHVWSNGKLRLYSVLIGLGCGCILYYVMGSFNQIQFYNVANSPWVALPILDGIFNISFAWSLLPLFIIISVTDTLKSFGSLNMCGQFSDDQWQRPEIKRISNGLVADALSVITAGLLGGVASNVSASGIVLCRVTGAASRVIGYVVGGLFIILGFFPKIFGVLLVIPAPVMGAILLLTISFVVITGIQVICSSGRDYRKLLVISFAFVFGLSLDMLPSLFTTVPHYLQPFMSSSLFVSTVLAVVLNQILRIGSKQEVLSQ